LKIMDSRLYKDTFRTFEEYCRERWEFSRPRAYQLIEAAKITRNLSTVVDIQPTSERQTRPLTNLEPEQQAEVWKKAVETAPEGGEAMTEQVIQSDDVLGKVKGDGEFDEDVEVTILDYASGSRERPLLGKADPPHTPFRKGGGHILCLSPK
jgi:hypothetical protein